MRTASARLLTAAALSVAAVAHAPAQSTPPPANDPPQQEPKPQQQPKPAPIDPARAAAEILRRRLGLKPGPEGLPPKGPPETPPAATPEQDPAPAAQDPQGAPAPTKPAAQEPEPAAPPPIDPTEQAARAIKKLLPNAETPPTPPIPDAQGTPEPTLPGAAPQAPRPVVATPPAAETTPWSGVLSSRYRLRHGGGATDQDLVTRLGVDVGRSDDPWSLHLRGRAFVNVDGERDDDPFEGLDHSFSDDVNARLYAAHLDLTTLPGLALTRVGRQDLNETPVALSFDGVRADSRRFLGPARAFVTAYAGVPVHHFEASSSGDLVVGAGAGCTPWALGRVRVDVMHLRDEFFAIDRQDTLWSVRWWQTVHESIRLSGLHTWRDGDARDLRLSALGNLDDATDVRVVYRELLSTQRQQVTDIDPYYLIAGEYSPYRQVELSLTRDLRDDVTASVGADVRRLRDGSDEGTFNREFDHVWADLTLSDLFTDGLSLTVAGNLWDSSGEDSRALTGELVYRPDRELRVSLGAGYDLFRYDVFAERERVRVRSYYVRCDRRLGNGVRLDCGYELLRDDVDEFHLFRMGVTWTF